MKNYLSQMKRGEPGEGKSFDSVNEIRFALESQSVTLNSKINYRIDGVRDDCGDYMYSFFNPPEHWDNTESFWFFKEVNK